MKCQAAVLSVVSCVSGSIVLSICYSCFATLVLSQITCCAGSFSGAVVSACVQPLDVIRTRLQADAAKGISRSTAGAFRVLVKEQGVRYMSICALNK